MGVELEHVKADIADLRGPHALLRVEGSATAMQVGVLSGSVAMTSRATQRADRLAEHLADTVAAVGPRRYVGSDVVMTRIKAHGMVR